MTDEKLNHFTLTSIENEILDSLNTDDIMSLYCQKIVESYELI